MPAGCALCGSPWCPGGSLCPNYLPPFNTTVTCHEEFDGTCTYRVCDDGSSTLISCVPPPITSGGGGGGGGGGSTTPSTCPTGEGVNTFSVHDGNVRRRVDELTVAGRTDFSWERYHNSIRRGAPELNQKTFGSAGSWRSNWHYELLEENDPKTGRVTFELIYPSGDRRILYLVKSKNLSAPKGLPERGRLMNGGVQITLADNSRVFFMPRSQFNRKPRYDALRLTRPTGEQFTFRRDARGRLLEVKASNGDWLRVDYKTIPMQTSPLVRVGNVVRAPARGAWQEIRVAQTNASARVLSVRLQVPAQAEIAEVEFFAAGTGARLTGTVYRGVGAAAFDGVAGSVFKNTNTRDSVMLRFDLPLGASVRLGKVRILPAPGAEARLVGTQVKVGLVASPRRSLAVVSQVRTSDGRRVTYGYDKIPWTGGEEHVALTRASYGDVTQATYRYSTRDGRLGPAPLLLQADDPRYAGRAKQIAYEYHSPVADRLSAGTIRAEKHPVTGAVWARLEISPSDPLRRTVHYSDDRAITYRLLADGSGRIAERMDSLGRKTNYFYSKRSQGPAHAVRDHKGATTRYTLDERGRATGVRRPQEPKRRSAAATAVAANPRTPETGRTIWRRDETGRPVATHRDATGRVQRVRFADGTENKFTYDPKGRLVQSSLKGRVYSFAYDAAGRRTSRTDPTGQVTRFAYDPHGQLTRVQDPLGRETRFERDERGQLLKTIHPDASQHTLVRDTYGRVIAETNRDGRKATYVYDLLGRKTREVDFAGRTTQYEYSELPNSCGSCTLAERPTRIVHPDGRATRLLYDSEGRLLAITENADTAASATTTYAYDSNNQITSVTFADGATYRNLYNARGHLVATIDPANRKTTYETNVRGERLSQTDPAGRKAQWSYHKGGVVSVTTAEGVTTRYRRDALGREVESRQYLDASLARADVGLKHPGDHARVLFTRSVYDAAGNLLEHTDAERNVTKHTYDGDGRRLATRLHDGKRQTWEYDAAGRRVKTTTLDGVEVRTTYDSRDRVLSETDSLGRTTTYVYDNATNRVTQRDPLGRMTVTAYSATGHVAEIVHPDGTKTSNTYTSDGRVGATTDALGNTTRYAYDAAGNLGALTDARGNTYRFQYDVMRRRTATIYPDGSTERWVFNRLNQLVTYVNRAGQTRTTAYNAMGRPVSESWTAPAAATALTAPALPPAVSYSYNAAGQLVAFENANARLTFSYDALGRVASETSDVSRVLPGLASHTVGYAYDAMGRRAGLVYPDRTSIGYGFDARGRLAAVSAQAGGVIASYEYDQLGRTAKVSRKNGALTTYGYDAAGQLTEIIHQSGNQVVASSRYTLDAMGRRTAHRREDGAVERYGYDPIGQLTSADYGTTPLNRETFAYDAAGNRTEATRVVGGSPPSVERYAANALNQLLGVGGAVLRYDANGNLVDDGRQSFRYDGQNRLVEVESSTVRAEFFYDARNHCVLRKYYAKGSQGQWVLSQADSRVLTYDAGWNLLTERGLDGETRGKYVYGGRIDEMLRADISEGPGVVSAYPLADGLGSTVALTNASGGITDRFRYDVYGLPRALTSDYKTALLAHRFLFTGREWLGAVGLTDHRRRHYSPSIGRWGAADPLGFAGGINLYNYVLGSPTNFSDPNGETLLIIEGGAIVIFTGIAITAGACLLLESCRAAAQAMGQAIIDLLSSKATPTTVTLAPPGRCQQGEYDSLADAVRQAKDKTANLGGCTSGDGLQMLKAKKAAWLELAAARSTINNRCFDGGDAGHQIALAQAWNVVANCDKLIQACSR